jgi:hypothetical protein
MTFTLFFYLQSQSNDPTSAVCAVVFIVVIVLIAITAGKKNDEKAKALAAARDAYQNALRNLKANPTDPNLRQLTLGLGRAYSNLTRNKKGVTIFDEVALSNDISAACAGAANILESTVTKPDQSIELRLSKLADLKAQGLIDEAEYAARRERILDEV